MNPTETEERKHLRDVTDRIASELDAVAKQVAARHAEMQQLKEYLHEKKSDMDGAEKASVRQSVEMMNHVGDHGVGRTDRLARLVESPYFGRIDVAEESPSRESPSRESPSRESPSRESPSRESPSREGQSEVGGGGDVRAAYIGVHSFYDGETESHLVYDWRAPISSMFYEFELGEAHYDAPEGRTRCEIRLKRQYRIENRELQFMLETSLNIQDDILQEELSRASDDKMKNIVATIQRDQNAIIRNDASHTLIIQGAAGSGKTSIALHRIAFLLYKYKDTIRSDEILIVSPNKVFAHYISQVLPELGEEMIRETTMERLASDLLDHRVKFQTFSEQVATLLRGDDEAYAGRVRFKASPEMVERLREYARFVRNGNVVAADVKIGMFKLDAAWIEAEFRRRGRLSTADQVTGVLQEIVDHMQSHHRKDVAGKERTRVRGELKKMLRSTTLKGMYKGFYEWLGEPEMFKPLKGGKYEYSDVFPLVYLQMLTGGTSPMSRIKHVVIDEMQDYTPVQYEVISHLYDCKKTILGDHNQSVSPLSASTAEAIGEILPESECTYMHKSYRSTLEITELAQRIRHNPMLVPIARHGDRPLVVACQDEKQEAEQVRRAIETFRGSGHNTLGIVCKTQDQAKSLYRRLGKVRDGVRLLDARSTVFRQGVMIATAFLAKGLEFDEVIVPGCDDVTYAAEIDRHMLYVACTRAMHRLTLTHTGEPSRLLASAFGDGSVDQRPATEAPRALAETNAVPRGHAAERMV